MVAKGLINRYAISYVDANRKAIKAKYPTDTDFIAGFEVTPEMIDALLRSADKEGVERNDEEAAKSRELFEMVIKGLIGRDVYDNATYFKVYNNYDPIFREALRIINSDDYDRLLSAPKE